jgi:hypothetical protein
MKNCPTCGKVYEDDTLAFCFEDGTTLVHKSPARSMSIAMTLLLPVAGVGLLLLALVYTFNQSQPQASDQSVTTPQAIPNNNSELERIVANARNAVETAANRASISMQGKRAQVISENANLRRANDSASEVVQIIPTGTTVEWLEQRGAWFSVRYNGKSGWMHGNTLRLLPQAGTSSSPTYTIPSSSDDSTRRRYEECVRQRTAFGVDTSPCSEWAHER